MIYVFYIKIRVCNLQYSSDQVAIGFGLTSDRWSRWSELFRPITERSEAKPKEFLITFYTQSEAVLLLVYRLT